MFLRVIHIVEYISSFLSITVIIYHCFIIHLLLLNISGASIWGLLWIKNIDHSKRWWWWGGGAVWKAVFPLLRFGVENPYNTHHYTFRKRFLVCFLIGNSVIVTQFLCLLPRPSFLLLKCDWLICQGRLEKSLASHNTEPVSRASLQF